MTTSTNKSKGPIRTEAVLPIVLILVGMILYFHFIFDWHLKRSIEILGSRVYGAEINVGSIKTSFFNGSFLLNDLEVTNKEDPKLNSIKIHSIKFGFLWDALLRLKFVINEAGVDGIEVNSPRNKIGLVKLEQPENNSSKESDSSKNSNTSGGIGASLSGVTSIVKGIDDKSITESLRGNLKSETHIKKLQADLKDKEKLWKERIDKLPQKGEFEALAARAKKLKFDTHDLKQFAADVKEADSIRKEADTKIKTMKDTTDGIKADVSKFKSDFNQIDDLVKEDIASVKTQLKLPALDAKSLSKSIFGKLIDSKMGAYKKYWLIAQKYLPPNLLSPKKKGESEANAYIPTQRGAGKNYRFPVTVGYPLFWLKRATISSEPTSQGLAGKVAGELTNVTSDPAYIKKPAVLDVRGEFARSNIYDTHLKIVADHIASAKDSLEFTVGAYPLLE
ncbi:MAG: TIGR03545 family protein, partial [Bdellovibrionales bacterium]